MRQLNRLEFYLNSEGGIALCVSLIFEYLSLDVLKKYFLLERKGET